MPAHWHGRNHAHLSSSSHARISFITWTAFQRTQTPLSIRGKLAGRMGQGGTPAIYKGMPHEFGSFMPSFLRHAAALLLVACLHFSFMQALHAGTRTFKNRGRQSLPPSGLSSVIDNLMPANNL